MNIYVWFIILQIYTISSIFFLTSKSSLITKREIFVASISNIGICFIEELMFRHNMREFLISNNIPYTIHITSILFGLMHFTNILISHDESKFKKVVNQVIFTTALGYICYSVNDIKISTLVHYVFNIVNMIAYSIFVNRCVQNETNVETCMKRYIRKRSSSVPLYNRLTRYNDIPESKYVRIPNDIKYMWKVSFANNHLI